MNNQSLPYLLGAGGECPECGSFSTTFDPFYGHRVCEECGNVWAKEEDDPDYDEEPLLDLGPCCACGQQISSVLNIVLLDRLAPIPGTGWGCVVCNLPEDGAMAVICDQCADTGAPLREVCCGYPSDKHRAPFDSLQQKVFRHTLELHEREHQVKS